MTSSTFPSTCYNQSNQILAIANCEMADIKFPLLGTEWPRFKLTYLVISLDFAIILSFILYILITDWNIKREAVINDEDFV